MSEITRDEIKQIIHSELTNTNLLNDIHSIHDSTNRIDQQTSRLVNEAGQQGGQKYSQYIYDIASKWSNVDPSDVQDIKLRVQNIERGIAQIVQYLKSQESSRGRAETYRD